MKNRLKRLIETFIAKKYVAWVVATLLLIKGFINGETWAMLTASIFVIDAYSKKNLLPHATEQN